MIVKSYEIDHARDGDQRNSPHSALDHIGSRLEELRSAVWEQDGCETGDPEGDAKNRYIVEDEIEQRRED
jgi:hypothetical protein